MLAHDGPVCGAAVERAADLGWIHVDPHHVAAMGSSDLADQAEADHRHHRAQRGLDQAHAMQGNRAHRDEGRFLVRNAVGDLDRQVARDHIQLRVVGVTSAGAGHAVAQDKAGRLGPCLQHAAGERVAQGNGQVELGANCVQRGQRSLATGLFDDSLDQVGSLARLGQQVLARQVHDGALGSRGDERNPGLHQDAAARSPRSSHLHDGKLTRLVVL